MGCPQKQRGVVSQMDLPYNKAGREGRTPRDWCAPWNPA